MADDRRVSIVPLPVYRDAELSDHGKLVAAAVGSFMNQHGRCYPGIHMIAEERGCSVRHAQRGIMELVARKHLAIQYRQRLAAILEWLHPLTGHTDVRSNPLTGHTSVRSSTILTGQKSPLDRTESGPLRVLDRTYGVRQQNEVVNEVNEDGAVHTERSNSNVRTPSELPRQPGRSEPTKIDHVEWRKILGPNFELNP